MEEDKKSLPEDRTQNETNRRQVSFSVGDFTANHPSAESSLDQAPVGVARAQSVPNNSIHRPPTASENNEFQRLIDDLETSACGPSATPEHSRYSLRTQSEFINIPSRSNLTIRNRIRFMQDIVHNRANISESQSTLTSPNSVLSRSVGLNDAANNADLILIHAENLSFNSSESLIAKDSMGQSLVHLALKKSTTTQPGTRQPPPYHVATANDTASVQIQPAATSPLVLYSAPPLTGAPPTYSALLRVGPEDPQPQHQGIFSHRDVEIQPSAPFIAPPPPPTYAQSQGFCVSHPLQFTDIHDSIWGNEPISIICPHCHNYVITSIHFRRSNMTHYSALALCICGCWPCCLLPYCMQRCKCAHHICPICANVVGVYSPWQVS